MKPAASMEASAAATRKMQSRNTLERSMVSMPPKITREPG
jgi:hypothetical protein